MSGIDFKDITTLISTNSKEQLIESVQKSITGFGHLLS